MADISELKQQLIEACKFIINTGVMSLSNHGNFSARVPDSDTFLLTAGGSFDSLGPDQIALFQMDGTLLDGAVEPASAEIVEMHGVVYRLRSDMGAAVHTHSPMATSYAVAGQSIPLIYEALARFDMTDGVPLAAYGPRGSRESVDNIAKAIETHPNIGGVLLANHGVLAFGADPMSAARANVIIEEAAILGINAGAIGKAERIPANMVAYTQRRRDEFASAGVRKAQD
ncbi:MAG: class II aldolase/adducin family protein [Chloroflexi bacterium]|nr:class II aldolase/adducin family protein [Chloroflexota bacterium]